MRVLEQDKVDVEAGDMLCLWTGLDRMILRLQGRPDVSIKAACAVLDGSDARLLHWITDTGVAAIAADNLAVEAVGQPRSADHTGTTLPLHEHCLFKLGVHLGELWLLASIRRMLCQARRPRALLTAPTLRLAGAVGSPVTPVATVSRACASVGHYV